MIVLTSACIGQGSAGQENTPQATIAQVTTPAPGMLQGTVQPVTSRTSLSSALAAIEGSSVSFPNATDRLNIYNILGRDVDAQGEAASWILYCANTSGTYLAVFDAAGRTLSPLGNTTVTLEAIDPARVVTPQELFAMNAAVIREGQPTAGPVLRELELKNGIYTLTITSSGSVRVLDFNATTGAPLA